MKNKFYLLLLSAVFSATAGAQVLKDVTKMKSTARRALMAAGEARAATADPQELRALGHCAVMGYADGRFAVVSADGQQLLGVSTAQRSAQGQNPGFEWWLSAIDRALSQRQAPIGYTDTRPNPKRVPVAVEPLMSTHWGQLDPYNRLCPYDTLRQERTAVGCVATSMAQVMNYYGTLQHGTGQRTVYYPYQDETGQAITVDFEDVTYRWDLFRGMVNFRTQPFTDEQAEAISTVLLHMGVAADMRYGIAAGGGSATTAAAAAEGLRNYLQEPDAQAVFRDSYSDEEWMQMVFDEIGTGHPVIYGGQSFSGGHSFVLNGYDRNGLVYVNWGWNGDDEGYYNINLLNPGGTSFADSQDMIVGLQPVLLAPAMVEVALAEAGQLADRLQGVDLPLGCRLSVSGPMNAADFDALRQRATASRLMQLDLSAAQFDELPAKAFYGCHELQTLHLPAGIRHIGDGALADLRYLQTLTLQPASDADFVIDGHLIYNKEKTEIVCALPSISGHLAVPEGVTAIHPYAFAGCVLLESLELPTTVTRLETEALRNCYWLELLKVRSKRAVELSGYNIFDGIDKSVCTLYVPSGLKTTYSRRAQWKDFNDIQEFGTTVRANSQVRTVGEENPELTYTITGDAVTGTPHLYTDATISSPAGVYTIYVEAGTIMNPDVEYVNGRLIVEEPEAITDVTATPAVTARYDLIGRSVTPQQRGRGLYIERRSNGTLTKRIVK